MVKIQKEILLKLKNSKRTDHKVQYYFKLFELNLYTNLKASKKYLEEADQLIQDKNCIMYACLLSKWGRYYHTLSQYQAVETSMNDAISLFKKLRKKQLSKKEIKTIDLYYASCLAPLAIIYQMHKKEKKAFKTIEHCIQLNKKHKHKDGITIAYNHLGILYYLTNKPFNALNAYQEAIKNLNVNDSNNLASLSSINNNIANAYYQLGNTELALKYYKLCYEDKKKLKLSKQKLALTKTNIGLVYYYQKNYKQAIKYLESAFNTYKTYKSNSILLRILVFLSLNYIEVNQEEKCLKTLEFGFPLFENRKENLDKAYFLCAYTHLLFEAKNKDIRSEVEALGKRYGIDNFGVIEKMIKSLNQANDFIDIKMRLIKLLANKLNKEKKFERANKYYTELLELKDLHVNNILEEHRQIIEANTVAIGFENQVKLKDIQLNQQVQNFKQQKKLNELIQQQKEALEYSNSMLRKEIEQRKVIEKELRYKNKELTDFAHIASHDLKEPIRVIHNFAQLLDKRYAAQLDENFKTDLGFIINSSERMHTLVINLLEYAKTGNENIEFELCDLEKILKEKINDYYLLIPIETIQIRKLPKVIANKTLITQLFHNLIANAIKFRRKEVPFELEIYANSTKHYHKISVKDNGIGIAKEYQNEIFNLFRKLHTQKEYEGTGIGLATVKKIINLHEGEVFVESEFGKGSTFSFTIPRKA